MTTKKKSTVRKQDKAGTISETDKKNNDTRARNAVRPTMQAAATLGVFGKHFIECDATSLIKALDEQTQAISRNELDRGEEMLVAQAHTLDMIFHVMTRIAASNIEYPYLAEPYLKLALRAQSQARANWEALTTMKNPPMVGYVKQANIAHGHQQVNNDASHAGGNSVLKNKLLDENDGERVDCGATSKTGRTHTTMETVESLNWAKDGHREG